jgi:hypothetical protein
MAVNIITKFVLGQFAKRSARKSEGIATLLRASDPVVQSNVRTIEIILKNMGIDPKSLKSTDDVLKHMNYHKAMMNQHLKQDFKGLGLGKGIESLEKKKPFQGFNPRVQQDVDSIIKDLKNMEPVAAMKEANLIIGRKGKYKNLSGDEAQRILKDTDDHIFQRDIKYDEFGDPIKPEPDDFAEGGITRAGFPFGGPAAGKKALKAIMDAWRANKTWGVGGPPYRPEKTSFDIKALTKQVLGQEHSLKELKEIGESPLMQSSRLRGETFDQFNQQFKNIKANVLKEKMMERKLEAKAMINAAERTMKEATEEFNTMFGPLKDKKKQQDTAKRITDQLTRDSKKTLKEVNEGLKEMDIYMGMLQKQGRSLHQSGGLAYMLGEPNTRIEALQHAGVIADPRGLYTDPSIYTKGETDEAVPQNYFEGGGVGHGPWTKSQAPRIPEPEPQPETPVHHAQGQPNPMKIPQGIPSAAPRTMDPQYMQQQMMRQAMMSQGPRPMANAGGRIGFKLGGIDKGRRAFMKWLAGILGTGVAAGTGLLKLGKAAKPAAAVTETIVKSNAPGMPAWFPSLVKRVLKEGTDDTAKLGTLERQTVHTAKTPEGTPIQVTRDLITDDVIVDIGEQTKHGWASGRYGQPVQLQLKKGEWIEPTKGKKGVKTKDEFIVDEAEFTGGHPENVKFEESVQFKYGDHGSDFTEIEKYAIGKNTVKSQFGTFESNVARDKKVIGKQAERDAWAEGRAESRAMDDLDPDVEFASGGLARLLGE